MEPREQAHVPTLGQRMRDAAPRKAPETTRRALLDAGLRLLAADPAANAFGHLKAARVAAEAGRTSGAFFHHWASQEAYVLDLIDYAFRPEQAATLRAVQGEVEQALAADATVVDALLTGCRTALESLAVEPQTAIEFLMWKRATTDLEFGAWVRERYRELDAAGAPFFGDLIALTGRRVRAPFTVESAAALVTAVAHGLVLRQAVEPQTYPSDVLGWAVIALLPLLTSEPHDPDDAARIVERLAKETFERGAG
jgi:AcrR family transcriptional regulator